MTYFPSDWFVTVRWTVYVKGFWGVAGMVEYWGNN